MSDYLAAKSQHVYTYMVALSEGTRPRNLQLTFGIGKTLEHAKDKGGERHSAP